VVEKNTKSTEMFIKILGQEIINKRGQMEIDEDKNLEDEQFDDEEELSDD